MAASIVSNPTGVISAIDFVTYVGNLSDLGTAPEQRRFGYKLKNITDTTDITQYRYLAPHSTGLNFPLSFEDDLFGVVFTSPPPLGAVAIVQDVNAVKEVGLEYSERVINTDDCSVDDNVIGTTSSAFVLNSHPQLYDTELANAEPIVMHKVPSVVHDCLDTERYLWVYGALTVFIVWRRIGNQFILGSTSVPTSAGEVSIVPIGFNRNDVPVGTNIIDIAFGVSDAHTPFRIYLDNCCDNGNCAKNIYFQSRRGGFDVLSMASLSARTVITQHQEWCKSQAYDESFSDRRISGQDQIHAKSAIPKLIFQKTFDYNCIDARYLDDVVMSRNYFVKDYDTDGTAYLARFIVDSGQYTPFNDNEPVTLTLVGRYSSRIKMPY